ncbi:MAG: hypothetical protein RIT14_2751, partial [Pseudomonadota bacterium]
GAGRDVLTGGAGADRFIIGADPAEANDLITDFDVGQSTNETSTDNDFVDLSAFYNITTLAAWNQANPTQRYDDAVTWLRADQADGVLDQAGGLRITTDGTTAVDPSLLNKENTGVICFARGTLILTAEGDRPIETLQPGDLVLTLDHGYQPLRWIGSVRVAAQGALAPIVFDPGAIGNRRALRVSPQHRMLLSGWQADLLFDTPEVLAAAKMLVNDRTIRREEGGEVDYFHMLFDAHEIVTAEGALSESFHPGQQGWGALAEAARDEILQLFPELAVDFASYGPAVRTSLRAAEARLAAEMMLPRD